MSLISLICPSCGSQLENLDNSRDFFYCPYCGTKVTFDRSGSAGPSEDTLLERAENFLVDDNFENAKNYFNRVLDVNPRSAAAYMGLVVCRNRVKKPEDLKDLMVDYSEDPDYRRALEYSVGNDHVRYASVNDPDHQYKVGMYRLDKEAEQNKADLEKKQSELIRSLNNRISSLESTLAYDRNRVQTDRLNLSRKKSMHTGAVLKKLVFPIFLMIVTFLLIVFVLPQAIGALGQYGLIGGVLLVLLLTIWSLVRLIKAFTSTSRLSPTYEKRDLRNSMQTLEQHQAELAQVKQTLAQCEVSGANERQRLLAVSDMAKEKFRKEFKTAHTSFQLPD